MMDAERVAEVIAQELGPDARFLLAIVERDGSTHMLSTIKDPHARVEFLERLLKRARKQAQ